MIKKTLLILFFLTSWGLSLQANPLEDKIRDTVVAEFSKILNHPVKIAKLEGNLLKRAVFRDVDVGGLAHLKLVVIEYNLARVLASGGDFVSSIKSIKIDGARLLIERNARGDWNWGFKAGDPAAAPPVLNFPLSVVNAEVLFKDARGLGAHVLRTPFAAHFKTGQFKFQFTPDGRVEISAQTLAVQKHAQSPLKISGFTQLDGKKFNLALTLEKPLAVVDVAEYFLPLPGFSFSGGLVGGYLMVAHQKQAQTLPVDLQAQLKISDGVMNLPGVLLPLKRLSGIVAVQNDSVSFGKFQGMWGDSPLAIQGGITAQKFDMQILGDQFNLANLQRAFAVLKNQPLTGRARLQLFLQGKLSEAEFLTLKMDDLTFGGGQGRLQLRWGGLGGNQLLAGQIRLNGVEAQKLWQSPDISGLVWVEARFNGPVQALQIRVSANARQVLFQNQNLGQLQADMVYQPDLLKISSAQLQGGDLGDIQVSGDFDFKTQSFVAEIQPSRWKFSGLSRGGFSGTVQAAGYLSGSWAQPLDLKKWSWRGRVDMQQALLMNQWVENASWQGSWVSQNLQIRELSWNTAGSLVKISGEINQEQIKALQILPGSHVSLADIDILNERYPELSGHLKIEGNVWGALTRPQMDLQMELENLQNTADELQPVEKLTVAVTVSPNGLTLKNGLVRYEGQELNIRAALDFKVNSANALQLAPQTLSFDTRAVDLERWNDLVLALQIMWQKWVNRSVEVLGPASFETASTFRLDAAWAVSGNERTLHKSGNPRDSELYYYFQNIKSLQTSLNHTEGHFLKEIKGVVSGHLDWVVRKHSPWEITGDLVLKNFSYGDLSVRHAQVLSEKKDQGLIASLEIQNLAVTRGAFESIQAALEIDGDQNLRVHHVYIKKADQPAEQVLSGFIPLKPLWSSGNAAVSVNAHIPGSLFETLLLRVPGIARVEGRGVVDIGIAGPWSNIKMFSSRLDLTGTKIYFDQALGFSAPFVIAQQSLEFVDNRIQIRNLEIDWQGEDTRNNANRFKISGSVGFENVRWNELKEFPVDFDLQLQDGDFTVNLPSMLTGIVKVRNALLRGKYPFALTRQNKKSIDQKLRAFIPVGPTLNADITLEDGIVLVATKGTKSEKLLLEMQINLNIGVAMSVGVQGGLLGSDLSNLLTRYQFELNSGASLNIAGNLNYPRMDGALTLGAGYLAMFNRNFELASPARQRDYYQGDLTKVKKNQVRFKPISSSDDSLVSSVYFSMVAETVIESIPVTKNQKVTENLYLVIVEGPLSNLSSVGFEKYSSNDRKPDKKIGETFYLVHPETGRKLEPERMSELLTDLAPDFLRAMVVNQGRSVGNQNVEVRSLARDLTAEQLNVAFRQLIRPAERKLAKSVGLYDIQFQRDFSDVAERIFQEGASTTTANAQKINIVQVAFISELLRDRLYLTLNTRLDSNTDSAFYFRVSSLRLTLSLFRQVVFNEILLSYQHEFKRDDFTQELNTYLIEADHRF